MNNEDLLAWEELLARPMWPAMPVQQPEPLRPRICQRLHGRVGDAGRWKSIPIGH
jgi:hypothetical protein